MRKAPLLLLPLLLAGCTVAVEYGDIPQSALAQNPRYKPAQSDSAGVEGRDYFIVTSHLPNFRPRVQKTA
jgi:hypothetical protein